MCHGNLTFGRWGALCVWALVALAQVSRADVFTPLTFINPNSGPINVRTATGNAEENTYNSYDWLIPANGMRVVSHRSIGEDSSSISIRQQIDGATPIMAGVVTANTDLQYVKDSASGWSTLGAGVIGTASTWTLQSAPAVVWNRDSVSGVSYQYNTDYFDGLRAPVTQELFREGVEKIVAAKGGAATSSGGTSFTDTMFNGISGDSTIGSTALGALRGNLISTQVDLIASRGTSSASTMNAVVAGPSVMGRLPSHPAQSAEPESDDILTGSIDLPVNGVNLKLYFNPMNSAGPFGGLMAKVAAFVRRLIAWGLVAVFMLWLAGRLREMMRAPFAVSPFGDSMAGSINSIKAAGFGGGLGYPVRVAAFGLVLVALLTMPPAIMAAVTAGLPWADLVTSYSSGPGVPDTALAGAIAVANQVVPWALVLAMPVYYLTVEYILFPSEIFWSMFIKFLPL